jgi:hypothetical protein
MITLHPTQTEVYKHIFLDDNDNFGTVVCCSRGWGKSYMGAVCAQTAVLELLQLDWRVPNKKVGIIAPTFEQVTEIYYPLLAYDLGMADFAIKHSKDIGRFLFEKNVELHLLSYEAIERNRGKGFYFMVWDEPSSCVKGITPKKAWEAIIQPTIITRWSRARANVFRSKKAGRAMFIGTPEGYNFFYEASNYEETDSRWKTFVYDYTKSPLLDPEEIERIRHTIDPIEFAREYKASFTESGNSVFYCFNRKIHVRHDIADFEEGEDVHAFIDFNVGLQCTSFWALRGKQLQCINEFKGHPDTETLANAIKDVYEGHKITVYPDPTGRSRKTSAPVGQTDFTILQKAGFILLARPKSPPIVDSVAAVNQRLMTAAGDVNMYVHPRCIGVIESLERTTWLDRNPDTATINKSEGVEHYSDGVRYGVEYLFPVRRNTKTTARGFNF